MLPTPLRSAWLGSALVMVAVPWGTSAQTPDVEVVRSVSVMGTMARLSVWGPRHDVALSASEGVVRELERVEGVLSSWSSTSEVAGINHATVGEAKPVSDDLARWLDEALAWVEPTGGAFHPAIGALVDAWDLRGGGLRPDPGALAVATRSSGEEAITWDRERRVVTRESDAAWLDSGGFGKGAGLGAAKAALEALGVLRATVDLGGQLLVLSPETVEVGVAHPGRRDEVVLTLGVSDASVATSAQSERFVDVDGERFGHVLDPRTGIPVPAWGSATVVARDPLVADVLSTAFLVLGPEEGRALAVSLSDVGVLFLEDTPGGLRASHNVAMRRFLAGTVEAAVLTEQESIHKGSSR